MKITRKTDTAYFKNAKTNETEIIEKSDITATDWGFHFFVETEMKAYKSAYLYRFSPGGCKVEFAPGAQKWMITVFNENIPEGIDKG